LNTGFAPSIIISWLWATGKRAAARMRITLLFSLSFIASLASAGNPSRRPSPVPSDPRSYEVPRQPPVAVKMLPRSGLDTRRQSAIFIPMGLALVGILAAIYLFLADAKHDLQWVCVVSCSLCSAQCFTSVSPVNCDRNAPKISTTR
jgi:hypothetical protein